MKISYTLRISVSKAALAQLVEHRSRKAKVMGSTPMGGSQFFFRKTNRLKTFSLPGKQSCHGDAIPIKAFRMHNISQLVSENSIPRWTCFMVERYTHDMVQVFDEIKPPSNRTFGGFFASIFLIGAILQVVFEFQEKLVPVTVGIGLLFAIVSMFASNLLQGLNHGWFKIGLLLAKISNPLILGVMYLVIITPVAIIRRKFGQDPLRLCNGSGRTFWIDRNQDTRQIDEWFKSQY